MLLYRLKRDRITGLLLGALLICLTATGCQSNRAGGEALAKAGIATANDLGDYYDSLAQDTTDTWETEAFDSAIRGVSGPGNLYAQRLDALHRRARMARAIGGVYTALKGLAGYDAAGEVQGAASDLAKSVEGLTKMGPDTPDPKGIFGSVAADFATAAQSKSIRRGAQLGTAVLEKLQELQRKEHDVYVSISEERFNKVASISDLLIEQQLVASGPLLRKVPETMGTNFVDEKKAFDNVDIKKGLKALARARLVRMRYLSASATDSAEASTAELIGQSRKVSASEKLDLSSLLGYLDKTAAYLDQIEKLRTPPAEAKKKDEHK